MLEKITSAITGGVSGIISSVTKAIPTGFDNLFSGTEGELTNFASFALYMLGFGISIGLARWLAAKVGG